MEASPGTSSPPRIQSSSEGTEEDLFPKDSKVNKWVYTELAFQVRYFQGKYLQDFLVESCGVF